MKKALPVHVADNRYFSLPLLPLRWEVMKTALSLHLFDVLQTPRTGAEVAEALACDAVNTELLLNALVAMGHLMKEKGKFRNTEASDRFLAAGKETSLGEALLGFDSWNLAVLNGGMEKLVKEGPPPGKGEAMEDPLLWQEMTRKTVNFCRSGRAQHMASLLAGLPGSERWRRALDLGAGTGLLGIALAAMHPDLECLLLDRPAVLAVAVEVIREYGMEERVGTLAADYMKDPIGGGYDLIMASYVLNFAGEELEGVLKKCREALNPGGCMVIFSDTLRNERTAPGETVLGWLAAALQGRDFAMEEDALPEALLKAGFDRVRSRTLTHVPMASHGPVDFHLARRC
ncbi:methyltransferase [Desulfobotulus sp.]|jgi:2-polyprenyl-3-methyl-5-hydroxy-6-metoxy-1,4-benzoquinol methylase|uniref:methyltransferase n=1 Tax=Desulfobotulus sp. TaxID=1940337 RepID=UPI002A35B13D|nr:methyltransferase [Desulfobotulus sp.]MDY0162827.1 methyltransferase [Desulfobotulus sp.]